MSQPPLSASGLPSEFPIFPLEGALLLPHGKLPLNIFEPRYLAMVEDALGAGPADRHDPAGWTASRRGHRPGHVWGGLPGADFLVQRDR